MKKEDEVQLNIHALLGALGNVCDKAELPRSQELAAVSMLLAVVGFKHNLSKEDVLGGMSNTIDHMYESLSRDEDE